MKIVLASIGARRTRGKSAPADTLTAEFLERASRYIPVETQTFPAEASFLDWVAKPTTRTATHAILLDLRGKPLSSEEFAAHLGRTRDAGTQQIVLAIGPADGWSPAALTRAGLVFSLGRITLPHELARVVAAEQLYRAMTILAGHPYHSGH